MRILNKENREKDVADFFHSHSKNAWVVWDDAEIYLRKMTIVYEGSLIQCLCVANVTTHYPFRRKGVFCSVMGAVEKLCTPVYVENVFNEILLKYLVEKRGYKKMHPEYDGSVPCLIKIFTQDNSIKNLKPQESSCRAVNHM